MKIIAQLGLILILIIFVIPRGFKYIVNSYVEEKKKNTAADNGSGTPTGPANLNIGEVIDEVQLAGNKWLKKQLGHIEVDVPDNKEVFVPVKLDPVALKLPQDGSWSEWLILRGCDFRLSGMSDGVQFTLLERDGKVNKYEVVGTDIFLTSNIIFERQIPGPNTYGASVAIKARRTKGVCKEITVKRTYVNDELPLEIPLDHEIFVTQ